MYKKGGETTRKLRQADIIYLSLSERLSKSPLLCAFDPQTVIIPLECALQVSILQELCTVELVGHQTGSKTKLVGHQTLTNMTSQADSSSSASVLSHKQRSKSSLLCASSSKARSLRRFRKQLQKLTSNMEFTLHLHSKLEDYEQRRSSHVSGQKPSIFWFTR